MHTFVSLALAPASLGDRHIRPNEVSSMDAYLIFLRKSRQDRDLELQTGAF